LGKVTDIVQHIAIGLLQLAGRLARYALGLELFVVGHVAEKVLSFARRFCDAAFDLFTVHDASLKGKKIAMAQGVKPSAYPSRLSSAAVCNKANLHW
jgi:hypothetical protein